jgi:hypothetical protein
VVEERFYLGVRDLEDTIPRVVASYKGESYRLADGSTGLRLFGRFSVYTVCGSRLITGYADRFALDVYALPNGTRNRFLIAGDPAAPSQEQIRGEIIRRGGGDTASIRELKELPIAPTVPAFDRILCASSGWWIR